MYHIWYINVMSHIWYIKFRPFLGGHSHHQANLEGNSHASSKSDPSMIIPSPLYNGYPLCFILLLWHIMAHGTFGTRQECSRDLEGCSRPNAGGKGMRNTKNWQW